MVQILLEIIIKNNLGSTIYYIKEGMLELSLS